MYNKYFTMKRSELKEAIKNEITSVLLEGMSDEERENRIQHLMRTGAKEKPLRKLAAIGKKEDEENLKEGTWSLGKASDINIILSQLQDLSEKAYNIIGDDEFYNGIDAAITRAEELMMNAPLNEDEDEAPVGDKETEKTARGKDKITIDFRNVMKKYNELKEKDKKEAVEYLKSNQDIVKKYKKAKEVNV
jgi:D-alanyl-D-alanine carboxypeptidase